MAENMPTPGARNTNKWIIGCAVGCLVVAILGIALIGVVGYMGMQYMNTEGKHEFAQVLVDQYTTSKDEGKVPAEYVPDYDALVAIAQRDDASFWAVTVISTTVEATLHDGKVTPEEDELVKQMLADLQANPNIGVIEMQKLIEAHPELEEQMTQKFPEADSESGAESQPTE